MDVLHGRGSVARESVEDCQVEKGERGGGCLAAGGHGIYHELILACVMCRQHRLSFAQAKKANESRTMAGSAIATIA